MKKKSVLILIGIPDFDYSNEKSAVLSFLISIREAFRTHGFDAEFIFGIEGDQSNINETVPSKNSVSALKKLLKKWKWLYHSIAINRYLKRQKVLLNKLIKGKTYDLIIEFHTTGSTVGLELAKRTGAKLSVIFDSPTDEQFLEMYKTKSVFWKKIKEAEKKTMEFASKIMVYSPACEDHLRRNYEIKAEVSILPSALIKDVVVTRTKTETFNIGFIGSFLIWHKLDMLIEVFDQFYRNHTDSRLYLVGYGEEWCKIKNLVRDKGLENVVFMPGFVSEEELTILKSKFTVAVMPGSNWYGSPLKLFEYAQGFIPFIAPVSKTVESIFEKGIHCLFIEKNDEYRSLYECLRFFYLSQKNQNQFSQRAHEFIKSNFSKEEYFKKLIHSLDV